MAIEVEKKFFLDDAAKERLVNSMEPMRVKSFTDVYYDDAKYSLTCKDIWLRERSGRWELKIPLEDFQTRAADKYREIETEKEIIEYLNFGEDKPLQQSLMEAGYFPFASITTTRSKYKKDGFSIDLDVIDFGYELAEIEKMVESDDQMTKATEDILAFAKAHDLKLGYVRGKVIEYLRRKNRKHFEALVASGVAFPEDLSESKI